MDAHLRLQYVLPFIMRGLSDEVAKVRTRALLSIVAILENLENLRIGPTDYMVRALSRLISLMSRIAFR